MGEGALSAMGSGRAQIAMIAIFLAAAANAWMAKETRDEIRRRNDLEVARDLANLHARTDPVVIDMVAYDWIIDEHGASARVDGEKVRPCTPYIVRYAGAESGARGNVAFAEDSVVLFDRPQGKQHFRRWIFGNVIEGETLSIEASHECDFRGETRKVVTRIDPFVVGDEPDQSE